MAENKIKFIREYESKYSGKCFDVVYHTRRVYTFFPEELPKTAAKFIEEAEIHKEQPVIEYKWDENEGKYRKVQTGTEIIHTNEE